MEKITMNVKELVRATAIKAERTQKEVQGILDAMNSVVCETLSQANAENMVEVKILPSGVSLVSDYVAAHEGRNPKTGETITVEAKNRVKAKFYSGIKAAVND